MSLKEVIHMNAGIEKSSYANNSIVQKTAILRARQILEDTIMDMIEKDKVLECYKIADLGCSSGPNSLLVISNIIDIIHVLCMKKNQISPEYEVSLNDLFENDFNTIFKSLAPFYDKLKVEKGPKFGPCFISGVVGSFYGRLFRRKSLHFVHSSYCLHWTSQVPEEIENNKRNIYIAKTSPPNVFEAYLKQFQKDFATFLCFRSEEIVPNGRMVLTFLGRSIADPTSNDSCCWSELLAKSLNDMVDEGLVGEAELYSFNLPFYTPYIDEVKAIVKEEGSFTLDKFELFRVNWDPSYNDDDKDCVFDKKKSGKDMAKTIRAVFEPLLVSHFGFGDFEVDNLFERYANHVGEHLSMEKTKFSNIVISLTKK